MNQIKGVGIEYTPTFKSLRETGIYPIRSNMVLLKNQGNCTVRIDYACDLPPNGVLEYNIPIENYVCVWNMHIEFLEEQYQMFEGDEAQRKNLVLCESRILNENYSNYRHGS